MEHWAHGHNFFKEVHSRAEPSVKDLRKSSLDYAPMLWGSEGANDLLNSTWVSSRATNHHQHTPAPTT